MSSIISLSSSMQRRQNFQHDLMDSVDDYKVEFGECTDDNFVTGNMWLVKDYVMRFRAHWPSTRRFTDDLVSVGLEALCKYAEKDDKSFKAMSSAIKDDMKVFINEFRGIVAASYTTNRRRSQSQQPLEYHYPRRLREDLHGIMDDGPGWVDLMDSMEAIAAADKEQMFDLVLEFLETEHGIEPESLSQKEKAAILELSEMFR